MKPSKDAFNMQLFIISVIIVGVTLVLGIYINETISGQVMDKDVPASVINETGVWINTTGFTLSGSTAEDFASPAVTAIWNLSASGNYNVSVAVGNATISAAGVVTNASVLVYDNVSISYTYTYTNATAASTAADGVVSALATGTSWISILVVVGFATIILTMLTSGLSNATSEKEAVPYY